MVMLYGYANVIVVIILKLMELNYVEVILEAAVALIHSEKLKFRVF
jgi:hypothetical protein